MGVLSRHEIADYIGHRLTIAGYSGPTLFSPPAIRAINGASRGVPRLVNILANKSLLLVFGEGGRQVERNHVQAAVDDTPAAFSRGWWWNRLRSSSAAD